MKLLLYSWNANNEQILADNLTKAGFEVVWFCKECRHYTRDMELAMEMIPFIHAQGVEAVVSFNYFPIISMICNTCQILYYAWVYDCPHFTLYAKQVMLPCNHIGIFDREMVTRLREEYGVGTVYHAPLSVDADRFDETIWKASRQEKERFRCDISFVGSLYTGEHNYYDWLFATDSADAQIERSAAVKEEIDTAVGRQCFCYHVDLLRQAVADGTVELPGLQTRMERQGGNPHSPFLPADVLRNLMEQQGLMLGEDYFAKPEDILLAAVLEKKVTVEERRILLTEISRLSASKKGKFDFRFYTGSDTSGLPELEAFNRGMVDYHTQMPLVFAGSRINLNISLRSIHSGIPLRVLDIMACGGFVLSNWQPEIAEYFEEGAEIVTFDSLKDCLAKADYYLAHEEERRRIALNGQKKVQTIFSYQKGFERLFAL